MTRSLTYGLLANACMHGPLQVHRHVGVRRGGGDIHYQYY